MNSLWNGSITARTHWTSINEVLFRDVRVKSTNATKNHRVYASAFYHRSRNYGNRASGQSISRNNSIKSASLARKKSRTSPRFLFLVRFIAACFLCLFPGFFFEPAPFFSFQKFARTVGVSRVRINRDALVLWCPLKTYIHATGVTPGATARPMRRCSRIYAVARGNPIYPAVFALDLYITVHTRLRTTVRAADFDKIVITCNIRDTEMQTHYVYRGPKILLILFYNIVLYRYV